VQPRGRAPAAEHGPPGVALGQPARERLPAGARVERAPDLRPAVGGAAELVGGERDAPGAVRIAGVRDDREAEVAGEALADVGPRLAGIVAAVDAPVMLQVQALGAAGRGGDLVDALAELGILVGLGQEDR